VALLVVFCACPAQTFPPSPILEQSVVRRVFLSFNLARENFVSNFQKPSLQFQICQTELGLCKTYITKNQTMSLDESNFISHDLSDDVRDVFRVKGDEKSEDIRRKLAMWREERA
jgi:hypothetical protein